MYGRELARIHDAAFVDLAEAAARHVLDEIPRGSSLDIGCGSAIFHAAMNDWDCAGFDVSPHMIQLAKQQVPRGNYWVDDARTAIIGPADVVTATGEVWNYACRSMAELTQCLKRVAAAKPKLLLFDLATTDRATPTPATRSGRGWSAVATSTRTGATLTRTIEATVGQRTVTEVHSQHLFDASQVLTALEKAGFHGQRLAGYDDYPFQPGWDGFQAYLI